MCLPCAKEIINHQAETQVRILSEKCSDVEDYVRSGRLSVADAEAFLAMAIDVEKVFMANSAIALGFLVDHLAPPWATTDRPPT